MTEPKPLSETRMVRLHKLERKLEKPFEMIQLLHRALTHSSYTNEQGLPPTEHNERLEFLGDAVLELAISRYLFERFPQAPEGELSKIRAAIVCEPSLARAAAHLGLGEFLLLSRGEDSAGGRERVSLLADAMEALFGALFLDQGLDIATSLVVSLLSDEISEATRGDLIRDYKTTFQELVQKNGPVEVQYRVLLAEGPDHAKTFRIGVYCNQECLGFGTGRTKKEAEQQAARNAIEQIRSR